MATVALVKPTGGLIIKDWFSLRSSLLNFRILILKTEDLGVHFKIFGVLYKTAEFLFKKLGLSEFTLRFPEFFTKLRSSLFKNGDCWSSFSGLRSSL